MTPLRALPALLLLAACNVTAPPRDNAQWTSTVQGVQITWRWVSPGALGSRTSTGEAAHVAGSARWAYFSPSCVVDLDPSVGEGAMTLLAAHEAGHCLQARYALPGIARPDLGGLFRDPGEGFAQTYAIAYVHACGSSRAPLGWYDPQVAACDAAPDPRSLTAP